MERKNEVSYAITETFKVQMGDYLERHFISQIIKIWSFCPTNVCHSYP